MRKRRKRGLHPNLDRFKRAERNISQKFRTCTSTQEDNRLIRIGEHLVAIEVLEDLIESVFSASLGTVSYKRGRPSEEYTPHTFSFVDTLPGAKVGLVEVGIHLTTTFYEI